MSNYNGAPRTAKKATCLQLASANRASQRIPKLASFLENVLGTQQLPRSLSSDFILSCKSLAEIIFYLARAQERLSARGSFFFFKASRNFTVEWG